MSVGVTLYGIAEDPGGAQGAKIHHPSFDGSVLGLLEPERPL